MKAFGGQSFETTASCRVNLPPGSLSQPAHSSTQVTATDDEQRIRHGVKVECKKDVETRWLTKLSRLAADSRENGN
ncbi:hypothetical protein RBSWK_00683 [Rhodopirellula baltica SWK14]|uniref:Uncharacterized protein n=1 Tax=Rhodopirellula baltica SWK14 TaxID=993516 RepID=L7CM96_RHOBT|nr:hypothetical protein RBSWK_00683 [Rhodopirellula baltica SWK14]